MEPIYEYSTLFDVGSISLIEGLDDGVSLNHTIWSKEGIGSIDIDSLCVRVNEAPEINLKGGSLFVCLAFGNGVLVVGGIQYAQGWIATIVLAVSD